jgi:hypothetical protein
MEISDRVFLVKNGVPVKQIKPAQKRNFQRKFRGKQNRRAVSTTLKKPEKPENFENR